MLIVIRRGIRLLLHLDITLKISAGGGNDSSCKLFRSLKCFHIPFSLHEPNYFCTDLHSNGPDNFLMSNPNQGSSVELGLLWFGFTQHVWNTLLRFLSTGFNIKWVSRVGIRWPSLKPCSDCSATVRPCITLTWLPTTLFLATTSSGYIISYWRQLKVLYHRMGDFHCFVFFWIMKQVWALSNYCSSINQHGCGRKSTNRAHVET